MVTDTTASGPATATTPTTADATAPGTLTDPASSTRLERRRGRWLHGWDPENPAQWDAQGKSIARRNLVVSIAAEFLGFVVWAMWSIVVPKLPEAGFVLTADQMFWLIALPILVGATLRIPYTFAVPLVGGRNWTVVSALMLLIPASALVWAVQRPELGFTALLAVAALAGLGGGNFASSMANISFFYPAAVKGRALGINAAGGNLGTAVVQLVVPLVVVTAGGLALERAGLVLIPVILVVAVAAWRLMDNLTVARSDPREFAAAARNRHTWIISFLYIGTFGSFIGYSGVFPLLLASAFPEVSLSLAFLGALVGSLARPAGGMLADRLGGARVTVACFGVMAAGGLGVLVALQAHSFGLFFASFLVLFCGSGAGNGATYRMIPVVFAFGAADDDALARARKAAAGCLGISGAIGALGGFAVPRGFAASTAATGSIDVAIAVLVVAYLAMAAVTWAVYQRRGTALAAAGA
ncbi:MAG: MFS transporter [Actinomycetales bacterium]|nr:MFS transporter [Actinomycetales bacterium]